MTLIEILIAFAIVAVLAGIAIHLLFSSYKQRQAALGTLPTGTVPNSRSISQSWTTSPAVVTQGVQASFVLTVQSSQLSGLQPVKDRRYAFDVQPAAHVSIVSVTPADGGGSNWGSSDSAGTLTVVIIVNSVPPAPGADQPAVGVITAQQINSTDPATATSASFTIQ